MIHFSIYFVPKDVQFHLFVSEINIEPDLCFRHELCLGEGEVPVYSLERFLASQLLQVLHMYLLGPIVPKWSK